MKNYDAIVIGAGPGGYVCAIRLAQLGKKTAIVEKEFFGGVCLNVGCIPSKALIHASKMYHNMSHEASEMGFKVSSPSVDMNQLQKWKNTIVKKLTDGVSGLLKMNKVDSFKGTATFKDSKTIEVKTANGVETLSASNFVVATGSRIIELPNFPFDGKKIINSTQALDLNWIPKKFAVIGGGFIGIEIGIVFAKLGSKVTIIEASPNILSTTDRDLVAVVEKKMKKLGIEVLTNTKADKIDADCILVSVGRVPNSDNIGLEKLGVKLDARKNLSYF